MDYSIYLILEARACAKPDNNLEALKQSLQRGLDLLSAEELRRTALNFWKRLFSKLFVTVTRWQQFFFVE